ncbi:hypothetical protein LTR35_012936 [Friedmanniomyces endolithicus]|uniref:Uncharacterized protein n=1 Tax=Friedmanniomyces endolithicus TaxID=329885 RepID=A0AAN6J701_9PEZI|nr:hypothetical protein LTR35_012936 [Friedmanniomyces endolithicus]KAK0285495.1 hypothetical protein LTS00_010856 [Friedmanniomyces endolithicus]KAK0319167.1 hypothetical protein LTR82_009931 [Friedmanniomyces endolithicus]
MASLARESSHRLKPTARPSLSPDDATQRVPIDPNDLELGPVVSDNAFSGPGDIVVPAHLLELHTLKSGKSQGKRPDSDTYGALMPILDDPSGDTMLFQKLSSYDLHGAKKHRTFDKKSPLDGGRYENGKLAYQDPAYFVRYEQTEGMDGAELGPLDSRKSTGLERSVTILSRIRQNSVVQATTEAINNVTETAVAGVANIAWRTSLANLYEQAKTKGQTFQRKKWVQTLFEYMIYLILVGMPLWKGAVWWLYWVVDHVSAMADVHLLIPNRKHLDAD